MRNMRFLLFTFSSAVHAYAALPSIIRAMFNFALIVAVLTAIKIQLDAAIPRVYDHDPKCVLAEKVYQYKPCKLQRLP